MGCRGEVRLSLQPVFAQPPRVVVGQTPRVPARSRRTGRSAARPGRRLAEVERLEVVEDHQRALAECPGAMDLAERADLEDRSGLVEPADPLGRVATGTHRLEVALLGGG